MTQFTIEPYRHMGGWVFDDPTTGLVEEGLVRGVEVWLNKLTEQFPYLGDRFRLSFSDNPADAIQSAGYFVDYLTRVRPNEDSEGGWWYISMEFGSEGWLCESMKLYFEEHPRDLWIIINLTQHVNQA